MHVSSPVRFGVLALVGLFVTGLAWLGFNRYSAEQRAMAAATAVRDGVVDSLATVSNPAVPSPAPAAAAPAPAVASPEPEPVVVHVAGAVVKPNLYKLPAGARVFDAIEAAGGALPDAQVDSLNLAEPLQDGSKVCVASKAATVCDSTVQVTTSVARASATTAQPAKASGAKINVNTATEAQLRTVSGIGPTTAKAIVDYRKTNGLFKRLEDLDKVKGIGSATLSKIRESLTL